MYFPNVDDNELNTWNRKNTLRKKNQITVSLISLTFDANQILVDKSDKAELMMNLSEDWNQIFLF